MYWRVYIQVHVERPSFGRPWCLSTGEPVISFWDHVRWDDSLFIYTLWVSIKTSTFYFVNTLVKNQLIKVILVHRISDVETVYHNWKKYFHCILWNADHVSDYLAYVSSKFDESKIASIYFTTWQLKFQTIKIAQTIKSVHLSRYKPMLYVILYASRLPYLRDLLKLRTV